LTEAKYYLKRSLELNPKAVDVRINYAVALGSLGELEEALKQISLAPKLPNTHYIKGSILEKLGQREKALVEMEAAIRLKPDYGAAHLAAARYLGRSAAATAHLKIAAQDPDPKVKAQAMGLMR
jgi:tetratricopeptide (TPR) repeat protein